MKFPAFTVALLITSLVYSSCEYRLDSQYFRNLEQPDSNYTVDIEITPQEFPEELNEPVWLTYHYYPSDLHLYGVRVKANDFTLYESTLLQDSFLISPSDFDPGDIKLTIEFITDSKSGSLADLTGYEAVLFGKSWEFYKPDVCYSGMCHTRIHNDNGILKISWDTTTLAGFKRYRLFKTFAFAPVPELIAEFTDIHQTEYHDRSYFGGTVSYWVEAETDSGTGYSPPASVYFRDPSLQVLWVKDNNVMMYWNTSLFSQVMRGYELSVATSDTTQAVLFASDNPVDTTYLLYGLPSTKQIQYTLRYHLQGTEPETLVWSNLTSSTKLTYKPKALPNP